MDEQLYYRVNSCRHKIPEEWRTFTVIVACVGVGNVSQLACDFMIYNLKCELVGNLDFCYLPAVVGADPYSNQKSASLMTCSQLYANNDRRLVILQTRSAPFHKCRTKHVEEVDRFLCIAKFARVILLSSSFAMQRKDAELIGSPLRYALSGTFDESMKEELLAKQWPQLIPHNYDEADDVPVDKNAVPVTYRLPGCGIANRLFDKLCESQPNVCLLNTFASEGDNAGDALFVVQHLNDWLQFEMAEESDNLSIEHWLPPPSWSLLFGNRALDCLY